MAATDWLQVSNDRIESLAIRLREAGIDAEAVVNEFSKRMSLAIKANGVPLDVKSLALQQGYGYSATSVFGGIYIRYDWERGGMGSIRYPLRKDGTIDFDRLKDDIESFTRRERLRREAADTRTNNRLALDADYTEVATIAKKLSGAGGAGVYIETENDGSAKGRLRFKVSGHISPARALAILAAVAATTDEGA